MCTSRSLALPFLTSGKSVPFRRCVGRLLLCVRLGSGRPGGSRLASRSLRRRRIGGSLLRQEPLGLSVTTRRFFGSLGGSFERFLQDLFGGAYRYRVRRGCCSRLRLSRLRGCCLRCNFGWARICVGYWSNHFWRPLYFPSAQRVRDFNGSVGTMPGDPDHAESWNAGFCARRKALGCGAWQTGFQ
jgi:hypothetical protein